jgi:hypothetical protein
VSDLARKKWRRANKYMDIADRCPTGIEVDYWTGALTTTPELVRILASMCLDGMSVLAVTRLELTEGR